MAKWADYCIFEVHFNWQHTHIDGVRAFPDNGESLGAQVEFRREQVIALIRQGKKFITIFKKADGNWIQGQLVFIITIRGVEYIKTVSDNTEKDNLDKLPEY